MRVFLIGDVLDKQLVDARGENAGRIDGIVLELEANRPPRVMCIEVSPIALLGRLSVRFARWYARLDRRLGPERGHPFRIAWRELHKEGRSYSVRLNADATPINALDRWLRTTIVDRIPGG